MSQQNKKHLTNSKTMDPTTFIYMYVFETKDTFPYGQPNIYHGHNKQKIIYTEMEKIIKDNPSYPKTYRPHFMAAECSSSSTQLSP